MNRALLIGLAGAAAVTTTVLLVTADAPEGSTPVRMACTVHADALGQDELSAQGLSVPGPYLRLSGVGYLLQDGGTQLPSFPPGVEALTHLCSQLPGDVDAGFQVETPQCACAKGPSCLQVSADGGTAAAPMGVTLQPGTFSGECAPKVCGVLAGQPEEWPADCPAP